MDFQSAKVSEFLGFARNAMPEAYLGLTTVMPVPAPRAAMCGMTSRLRNEPSFSLKLRASLHLKIDVWKTILSFWEEPFSGANLLVSGRVYIYIYIYIWV